MTSHYAARLAEIERLETHVLDRLAYEEARGAISPDEVASRTRATHERDGLVAANARFVARLGHRIASGRVTPAGLRASFARIEAHGDRHGDYGALDELVANLFDGGGAPEERMPLEPEMVAYQPTPARAILTLIERARLDANDVLYDLGAGLGHVVMFVTLSSDARAVGVEREPSYCEYAERSARRLNLARASFVCSDVRDASLANGTVFFLYTPFRGAMLEHVLAKLSDVARARPIRVCTYGPCTIDVARVPWLRCADERAPTEGELAVFTTARSV